MRTMCSNKLGVFVLGVHLAVGMTSSAVAGGRELPSAPAEGSEGGSADRRRATTDETQRPSARERRAQQRERRARETQARADERRVRQEREGRARGEAPAAEAGEDATENPAALPNGGQAGSVSSQAISLPTGEGSIQGMGESFTPSLSAGTGTFSVPITLPRGRAGVQPSIGLAYSTSGGNGNVGLGWGLSIPFIARQTDRGLPRYKDRQGWHEEEDRFIYNGGQELVPVDNDAMALVDASPHPDGEGGIRSYDTSRLPIGVTAQWQQYRARIEGGFMRFFRSPDSKRWVVQGMDGTRFDFGLIAGNEGIPDLRSERALQTEFAGGTGRIFAWHVTRMSDVHGSNVYYSYRVDGGLPHIESIHYVSPNSCAVPGSTAQTRACSQPLANYAIRVAFDYVSRPDVYSSYTSGWRTDQGLRLTRITVTAVDAPEGQAEVIGRRYLVRRYHLTYDPNSFLSMLASVQLEGRTSVQHPQFDAQVFELTPEESLGSAIIGTTLPPMTLRYSTMPTSGPQSPGFGGVSNAVHLIESSPPVSLDDPRTDLYDVNSDGLPDVVVTDPARYRTTGGNPASGVFWNGFTGAGAEPAGRTAVFSDAIPVPMSGGLSGVMSFSSPNVVPMDVDGDGRLDLLHMPRLDRYGYFTPARTNADQVTSPARQGWRWTYARVDLPTVGDDPRIDFVRDGTYYRVFDVNNDHLIDVVRTTGTVMQTWLNLGWVEGGDGRFGQATWTGSEWSLSSDPIETCLLHDGQTLDFGDGEVRLSDMNGDGIEDIVRIRKGRVVYWPGRGDALWGEGAATCARNEGAGREIRMDTPPQDVEINLSAAYLVDVNADGTSDIVQVRYREIDVWFNRAGRSWTSRITVTAPFEPSYAPRSRLIDIDGSGTVDLVYGHANAWKYMDLAGGMRPRLLVGVENGLGATTTLEYGSSADDYVTDLENATSCNTATCGSFFWDGVRDGGCDEKLRRMSGECVYRSGGSPVVSTVVRASETSDNFDRVGREETVIRNEYAYHNGYYEGIEQEFRGFGAADARAIGDASAPTQWTRAWFHQGRRPDAIASERLADNPYEALKGREYLTETFNEQGQYLSSAHASLTVRTLATSMNARPIVYAFVHQNDTFTYGHAPYQAADFSTELPALRLESVAGGAIPSAATSTETHRVDIRAGYYGWIRSTTDEVDNLGQVIKSTAHGRKHQDADGANATTKDYGEAIVAHTTPASVSDSPDGWLFRSRARYVTDGAGSVRYGESSTTFDGRGHPTTISQVASIVGVSPFSFAGGSSGFTQERDQTLTASTAHDAWGNPTASCGGGAVASPSTCLRYGSTAFDSSYAQFAETEAIAVSSETGSHCSTSTPFCMLSTSGTWDRGFGAVRTVTDPNGQVSSVGADGLARTTFVQPPSANGCQVPPAVLHYEIGVGGAPVHVVESITVNRDGACAVIESSRMTSRVYVDGLARARATLTYVYGGDQWEQTGIQIVNRRGLPFRAYEAVFVSAAGAPSPTAALSVPQSVLPVETAYDAFGRVTHATERDGAVSSMVYGAAETKAFDALDRGSDPTFAGTPSIMRFDGHGRTIQQVQALRQPGSSDTEYIHLRSTYRADGAATTIMRFGSASAAVDATAIVGHTVTRVFYFDTAGRRVGTSDPDTNSRSNPDPASSSWRYLYNRVGDLVAVRDPRGCGQDFFYDRAGRVVGEAFVSCGEAQPSGEYAEETIPAGSIGLTALQSARTVDARSYFDALPSWASTFTGMPAANFPRGRATASSDRGQRSIVAYDVRGQSTWLGKQMVLIPHGATNVPDTLSDPPAVFRSEAINANARVYDTSVTYATTTTYDHLGRVTGRSYPRDPDWTASGGSGAAPAVRGAMTYDRRGLPYTTRVSIGALTYQINASMSYGPNRLPTHTTYGATGALTSTWTGNYDVRQRPTRSVVENHRAVVATSAISLGEERTPFDLRYAWDEVSNLVRVQDLAPTSERLPGQMPQQQVVTHDSLYRVANIAMSYRNSSNTAWTTDVATDWRAERTRPTADGSTHQAADPMRREPAPMVSGAAPSRVTSLSYRYDWLGNMTSWDDPAAQAFHERELGAILNGTDAGGDERPSALYMASDLPEASTTYSATTDRGGYLRVGYGEGGNVESLTVHGQCRDASASLLCADLGGTGDDAARDAHLREHCVCAVEQHYQYRWDELNRLSEARRYDRAGAGAWNLAARQRYAYDAGNQRTVKQTLDPTPRDDAPSERIGLYVLPGDYERVGVRRNETLQRYDYDERLETESQYSVAGARVVWKAGEHTGSAFEVDKDHRVVIAYVNLVQSTASTQDLVSGLLVEQTTFLPNGVRETSRTSDAGSVQGEPLGFTGKEEDEEVGLVYFGERYLIQHLGRWASADPLSVHAMGGGEAGNGFHYVSGNILQGRDPIGLEEDGTPPPTPDSGPRGVYFEGEGTPQQRAAAQRYLEGNMNNCTGAVNACVLERMTALSELGLTDIRILDPHQLLTPDEETTLQETMRLLQTFAGMREMVSPAGSERNATGTTGGQGASPLGVVLPDEVRQGLGVVAVVGMALSQLADYVTGVAGLAKSAVRRGFARLLRRGASDVVEAAAAPAAARGRLTGLANEIREAGSVQARSRRTIAVGEDASGGLHAGSSNGFDAGQREAADRLGVRRVPSRRGTHAEEDLLREVPGLRRVGTSRRAPCGPGEHNCAGQLQQAGVEVDDN